MCARRMPETSKLTRVLENQTAQDMFGGNAGGCSKTRPRQTGGGKSRNVSPCNKPCTIADPSGHQSPMQTRKTPEASKPLSRSEMDRTFVFSEPALNRRLLGLLRKSRIRHLVDRCGVIHYKGTDARQIENEFICAVRRSRFPKWMVQTCPPDWADTYRNYMRQHHISYCEELDNGKLWFLLPSQRRPSLWKMSDPNTGQVSPRTRRAGGRMKGQKRR